MAKWPDAILKDSNSQFQTDQISSPAGSNMSSKLVTLGEEIINKENSFTKQTRRKNSDFIFDKTLRLKSFFRRRGVPFRRCSELDIQCGTRSFHLQVSRDTDEAVYAGSADLVKLFLSSDGLKLSDLNQMVSDVRTAPGQETEEAGAYLGESDEEFYDTVKSKNKKEKEARAESAKRMAEVEYLTNPLERNKRYKSVKEGLLSKISELESVSGVATFTVILYPDKDLIVYNGDPAMVTALFTTGIKRGDIPVTFNVRTFENEEVRLMTPCEMDVNACVRWSLTCARCRVVWSPGTRWASGGRPPWSTSSSRPLSPSPSTSPRTGRGTAGWPRSTWTPTAGPRWLSAPFTSGTGSPARRTPSPPSSWARPLLQTVRHSEVGCLNWAAASSWGSGAA